MANPFTGVLLNGRYYGHEASSFRKSLQFRTSIEPTQSSRTASSSGVSMGTFSLSLSLDNTYVVYNGVNAVGTTTWMGVSRLADLESYIGARGASMPILFVTPYGATFNVIPSGTMDVSIFNPDNPQDSNGVEFRVSLTLEALS